VPRPPACVMTNWCRASTRWLCRRPSRCSAQPERTQTWVRQPADSMRAAKSCRSTSPLAVRAASACARSAASQTCTGPGDSMHVIGASTHMGRARTHAQTQTHPCGVSTHGFQLALARGGH
jgi:hypothetical protein